MKSYAASSFPLDSVETKTASDLTNAVPGCRTRHGIETKILSLGRSIVSIAGVGNSVEAAIVEMSTYLSKPQAINNGRDNDEDKGQHDAR